MRLRSKNPANPKDSGDKGLTDPNSEARHYGDRKEMPTDSMACISFDRKAISFAATTLGAQLINPVFNFYYVKVFLTRYGVSESWFHCTQIIFMIWNAVNDPLFGYLQDNYNFSWVKSRRHSILYGAPFFALSFLVPWFGWADGGWLAGLHLLFSLCFYDTLFTFVLLAHCALFTEMSSQHVDRVRLVQYSQVASLLGSCSVFFCEYFSSNLTNYRLFQVVCVILAILAWLCMRYTGLTASSQYESVKAETQAPTDMREVTGSLWSQTKDIFTQRNFIAFVTINFCQIFHNTFLSNFSRIFYEYLLGTAYLSNFQRSLYYGLMNIFPQVVTILCAPILQRVGYYRIVRFSFVCMMILSGLLYMTGPTGIGLTAFFLLETVIGASTFSLFNLCLSDIVDEDLKRFNRKLPLSSMVFGINALITKPAISFAPMVTVAYLSRHGYDATKTSAAPLHDDVSSAMFTLLTVIPFAIAVIQSIAWSMYRIRDSHITEAKYVETG